MRSTRRCSARADDTARRRVGRPRRKSSARSRLHQLVLDRRPRSRGAHVAGDLRPAGEPVVLSAPWDSSSFEGDYSGTATTPTATPVALVNATAARRFFPDREPIGAKIRFWGTSRTIVGVVADEKFHGLTEASPIAVYTPLAQTPSANGAGVLLVRTTGDPRSLEPVRHRGHPRCRSRACGVRRRASARHALALDRSAPFHNAPARPVRRRCTRAGCNRHSRGAELRRVRAPPRDRYPHGARRPPIRSRVAGRSSGHLARCDWARGWTGWCARLEPVADHATLRGRRRRTRPLTHRSRSSSSSSRSRRQRRQHVAPRQSIRSSAFEASRHCGRYSRICVTASDCCSARQASPLLPSRRSRSVSAPTPPSSAWSIRFSFSACPTGTPIVSRSSGNTTFRATARTTSCRPPISFIGGK